jgi:genome maintenance exonuclease 1
MKILTENFKHPTLIRTDHEAGRFYQVDGKGSKLPSVTTMLSKTAPADKTKKLDDWRLKVGDEEADRIVKESVLIGEHLHKNLENHMLGKPERTGPMISKVMTNLIIKHGLCHVDEVWGIETPLYYPDLYAGTSDLVGVYRHDGTLLPCIMDFKNSKKHKKKEWIEDYILQLAAYATAHDKIHDTNIKGGVIMMATRDLKYLTFEIVGKEFEEAREKWYRRVDQFYKENPDFGK